MRYRLRTLLIVMTVAPPLIAFVWFNWRWVVVASLPAALAIINWMMQRSVPREIQRSVEKSIREGEALLEQRRKDREVTSTT
jgi:hypothetical protein